VEQPPLEFVGPLLLEGGGVEAVAGHGDVVLGADAGAGRVLRVGVATSAYDCIMAREPSRRRAAMPTAVRRLLWWMALPLAVNIAGAVFYKLPAVQSAMFAPNVWLSLGIPLACFAPVFVAFVGIWHGQRRIKRAVLAAHGRACIHCVHDLGGLGDTGTCPECGRAFDIAADQRSWARVNMHA
jgi:hypothetical protein